MTVLSRDEARGHPTVVWAGQRGAAPGLRVHDTPEAAARVYLEQQASLYGLSAADLASVYVHRVHDTGRGGIIVFFRQRVAGLEVGRTELKVLLDRGLELVGLTGNLHGGVAAMHADATRLTRGGGFTLPASEAVLRALGDVHGLSLVGEVVAAGFAHADAPRFDLAPGGTLQRAGLRLVEPARVTRLYFPSGGRLVPAYAVDALSTRAGDAPARGFLHVLDAATGQVLLREDRVAQDAYSYRVWADADGTPADNPHEDYSPHRTGNPETAEPGFVAPRQLTHEGRVHAQSGRVFPWLPQGATTTWGNNVHAYADHFDPDGYTEGQDRRAQVTPGTRDFPHVYDPEAAPLDSVEQVSASVVQLFYTTNWLHDYFYDSGFDEAAGNAQDVSHAPGGLGGDPVLAEAQNLGPDAQARNLASAYVPRDGLSPRLEFSLWDTEEARAFTVGGTRYVTGKAEFGPQRIQQSQHPLALAEDGTGAGTDACEPLQNDVTGAIVLADRGGCIYELKAVNAENAGAAGLVVINHVPGEPPPEMLDVDATLTTGLATLSITLEDGLALKELLSRGSLTGAMTRAPVPLRDASLDNTIVAHEWGHILSRRLTLCAEPQCRAMGEGWSDFLALLMMVRETDAPQGTYAVGAHAAQAFGQSTYFGVRRTPYSTNLDLNGLRLRHIANDAGLPDQDYLRDNGLENAQMHNAGEVWATLLFEAYQALLDEGRKNARPFAETRRRMADYVVDALQLAPADATFTEQRDALLMAARARGRRDDLEAMARAFARRGAGTCAVSPPRDSTEHNAVVEDGEAHSDLRLAAVRIVDGRRSCDADGVLDASEEGLVRVEVQNHGPLPAQRATVRVVSDDALLTFPRGASFTVAEVAAFGTGVVEVPIALAASLSSARSASYRVTLESSEACQRSVEQAHSVLLHYDLAPAMTDTVEGLRTTWTSTVLGGTEEQRWRVVPSPLDARDQVWFAPDVYEFSDTALQTPVLSIPSGNTFVLSFDHRHGFDFRHNPGPNTFDYWNGGVIELTEVVANQPDDWKDVTAWVTPGYTGTLDTRTGNSLGGRPAYAARNPRWPQRERVTLDFGTALQGKTVKLRFRAASSLVFRAHGWEVDNITVQGTATPPFLERVAESTAPCRPLAEAGVDQRVIADATVTLDGSGSSDRGSVPLAFSWRQVGGAAVALRDADTAAPSFTAPDVGPEQELQLDFELTVRVADVAATDRVTVTVRPKPTDPDAGTPDAGTPDAGTPDAGTPDAGPPPPDAGEEPDGGPPFEPPQRPGMHSCASAGGGAPLGLVGALMLLAARRRRPA
ncbi:M36 family metallopeptidase [Myxococcus sp. AS-1-15]|uniref:M36 family metallopeptidase n=1 Tax=Myxococcus sp. AS-1-15 TaxID=2874600 RepID=UPI00351D8A8E|nr:M36 family metallopeptidase [Myxococcus sp. AS-1-15]